MKARIKVSGEIIEVVPYGDDMYIEKIGKISGRCFPSQELDFNIEDILSYWDKLLHQYAGMAMQGMLSNEYTHKLYLDNNNYPNCVLNDSIKIATALVEKLKENKV